MFYYKFLVLCCHFLTFEPHKEGTLKNRPFFILFSFVFIMIFIFLQEGCDFIDEYRYKFIVKGSISNLSDLNDFQDNYLQLCKVSEDGKVIVNRSFEKGDIFISDLSKLEIKPNGFFKFKENVLEPGKYMVCIQGIKWDKNLGGWLRFKDTGSGNTFLITKENEKTQVIDLGTLIIPKG
jgi:hypothetical protein